VTNSLLVTAVVLLVYGAAALAVLTVYRATDRRAARLDRPATGAARRLAAGGLDRLETDAARRVVAGGLDRAGYRRTMAVLAALDAVAHPLTVPEPPRQDDGPVGR
jgi:hypothetical protein